MKMESEAIAQKALAQKARIAVNHTGNRLATQAHVVVHFHQAWLMSQRLEIELLQCGCYRGCDSPVALVDAMDSNRTVKAVEVRGGYLRSPRVGEVTYRFA